MYYINWEYNFVGRAQDSEFELQHWKIKKKNSPGFQWAWSNKYTYFLHGKSEMPDVKPNRSFKTQSNEMLNFQNIFSLITSWNPIPKHCLVELVSCISWSIFLDPFVTTKSAEETFIKMVSIIQNSSHFKAITTS